MSGKRKTRARQRNVCATMGAVLDFMRLLWALVHALQSASKRMGVRLGVTGPQRLVIRVVGRHPQISAGSLARILHVHPSTLTGVLRRLERRGYVDRVGDPEDGRRALIQLTDRGRHVDLVRRGTVEGAVRRVLSRAPRRRITAAVDLLRTLSEELTGSRL